MNPLTKVLILFVFLHCPTPLAYANTPPPKRSTLRYGHWLMNTSYNADKAFERGEYETAIALYQQLAESTPDRSVSFSRLCASYEKLGDTKNALRNCQKALGKPGVTTADYAHYTRLVLAQKERLDYAQKQELLEIIDHLQEQKQTPILAYHLECELGLRLENEKLLEQCTNALNQVAPEDPKTVAFAWALALKRDNHNEAWRLIKKAEQTDMLPAGLVQMKHATAKTHTIKEQDTRGWIRVVGIFLFFLLFVHWLTQRNRPHKQPNILGDL